MRQETNNEIDLLLRRMSRRDGGFMSDAEAPIDGEHLDADELSSYAQNALPPATRARYTEHLAECSSCRKLVTELSLSLGASTVAEVSRIPQPSALRKFLASLFSPMVLRYAVPALGVIVLAVVGIVVLRQQQGQADLVAQMEAKRSEPAAGRVQPEASTATPSPLAGFHGDLATEPHKGEERPAKSGDVVEKSKAPETTGAAAPSVPAKDQKAGVAVITEQPPTVVATPAPAAAPKIASAEAEAEKKKEEVVKKQPEAVAQTAKEAEVSTVRGREPVRDNFRRNEDTAAGRAGPAANKAAPVGRQALSGGARTGSQTRADEDKNETETRTVAGRRFRKERGIWVDTAYDSAKETTNVARGSEQFRALVADEPGIRTIAQQLDGEVIVVWKGRAYRIR